MKPLFVSCVVAVALGATGVHAHHSIAGMYDEGRKVTLDGVVVQFQFVNPHPFVMMDVQDRGGLQTWKLEMDNRHELVDVGVTPTTLKPGDRLVVTGSPAYKESRALYVRRLQRAADGFLYEQIGFSPRVSGLPR
jgi:uncharacterized protein DUF6152